MLYCNIHITCMAPIMSPWKFNHDVQQYSHHLHGTNHVTMEIQSCCTAIFTSPAWHQSCDHGNSIMLYCNIHITCMAPIMSPWKFQSCCTAIFTSPAWHQSCHHGNFNHAVQQYLSPFDICHPVFMTYSHQTLSHLLTSQVA